MSKLATAQKTRRAEGSIADGDKRDTAARKRPQHLHINMTDEEREEWRDLAHALRLDNVALFKKIWTEWKEKTGRA